MGSISRLRNLNWLLFVMPLARQLVEGRGQLAVLGSWLSYPKHKLGSSGGPGPGFESVTITRRDPNLADQR